MKPYTKRCLLGIAGMSFFLGPLEAQNWKLQPLHIQTRWAKEVTPQNAWKEYPRPQMVRADWEDLNGLWQYAVTPKDADMPATPNGNILVPFPIESALSGVERRLTPDQTLWYKRTFAKPAVKTGEKVLLHFGAVDWQATVYVNGQEVGSHQGGYESFTLDITGALKTGNNQLMVKVYDPSDQGINPHGKQTLSPGGIMYTPSSGIWQTVWLEKVPSTYIRGLKLTPDLDNNQLNVVADVDGGTDGYTIEAVAKDGSQVIATKELDGATAIDIPNPHTWSPDDPFLYGLEVRVKKDGKVVDKVDSYFGMRKIEIAKDAEGLPRIFLNNKFYYNMGVLDQGFWPEGLYSAPTDAALKFDIQASKAMGFNTIRKHIKVEPDRWYYDCDKLGMLVWQDMVNPSNDSQEARDEFEKESKEEVAQLYNHPCITTWVVFNEGWGVFDQGRVTKMVKDLDPSRLVDGHTGENLCRTCATTWTDKWPNSDMVDIHEYPGPKLPDALDVKARVLGEFGGIGVSVEHHLWDDIAAGWGYGGTVSPTDMKKQYTVMVDSLKKLADQGLSASIYTQPYDVEAEQNGLMTYDRDMSKIPTDAIRQINETLWPTTENYAVATKGFSIGTADVIKRAYADMIGQYKSGKRDSAFLRAIAIMALSQKDKENAERYGNEYVSGLKAPFIKDNVAFMQRFTASSKDPGFNLLLNNLDKIALVTDPKPVTYTIQGIIFAERVRPLLGENPDWSAVDAIIKEYPQIDGEFIIGNSVIRYLNAVATDQSNAVKNLVDVATMYDDRFHGGAYNDWAWLLFQKASDTTVLKKALDWANKEVERTQKTDARYGGIMDTYANLLYKLGRTQEAIDWETKAVAASNNEGDIVDALRKMKSGEKTW